MRVMVTGGSGYIGAHTVGLLTSRGDHVVVLDDFATGSPSRIQGVPAVEVDLARQDSRSVVADALRSHEIEAVIHFAARKQVGESVKRPAWYYEQNVGGLAELLMAMEDVGVAKLVFSSSAAVYGRVDGLVDERHETAPLSPYGATKLVGEQLIAAAGAAWGVGAASLRYFNVGGAGSPHLGDTEALNLIPMVFDRLEAGLPPAIFGDDYSTPDGTCIRDYVHVSDVAQAHLAVLDRLSPGTGHAEYNVGTGSGTSVREMIEMICAVSGIRREPVILDRRAGDPDAVVADVSLIRETTGWQARFGLAEIVESAWRSRLHMRARLG